MKTAIVYYSKHHGNTKKVLDAINPNNDIALIDVTENPNSDLSKFDRIGFASGIYYSKFQKKLIAFAEDNLPDNKEVFFIYTYGVEKKGYTEAIRNAVNKHDAKIIGEFGCCGFNTFGPFKFIGGIAKGHPNAADLQNAVNFYSEL